MANADKLRTIVASMDEFHVATKTAYDIVLHGYDQEGPKHKVVIRVATLDNLQFEFADIDAATIWATNLSLYGPNAASAGFLMMRLEQEKADQIIRDARIAALEKEIGEVGQTTPILDAMDAASAIIQLANQNIMNLTDEKSQLEAEAVAKADEAAALQAEVDALKAAAAAEQAALDALQAEAAALNQDAPPG